MLWCTVRHNIKIIIMSFLQYDCIQIRIRYLQNTRLETEPSGVCQRAPVARPTACTWSIEFTFSCNSSLAVPSLFFVSVPPVLRSASKRQVTACLHLPYPDMSRRYEDTNRSGEWPLFWFCPLTAYCVYNYRVSYTVLRSSVIKAGYSDTSANEDNSFRNHIR